MIDSLKIRGPFRGPTGYEHHVREFSRELARRGVRLQLIDYPNWGRAILPRNLRDPWFESLAAPVDASVVVHFNLPDKVEVEPERVNINFTMFEATRIPGAWVEHARQHDLIVLPSESSLRAWTESGVPAEKIRLCPLGVGEGFFRAGVPPLELHGGGGRRLNDCRVRLLNVSELGPRKNLAGLVRAWLRATTADDDAVLILKLGCFTPGSLDTFWSQVAWVERAEGKRLSEAAPIHVTHDVLADADMPRLFAAATHYISVSFGEGWDLAMIEAAACGLRLIAPDHSAYRAYLDETIAALIPSRQVPAIFPGGSSAGTLFENADWWLPDEEAAVELIRAAVAGSDGGRPSPRERIRERFTWQKATQRLIEILDEAVATNRRGR